MAIRVLLKVAWLTGFLSLLVSFMALLEFPSYVRDTIETRYTVLILMGYSMLMLWAIVVFALRCNDLLDIPQAILGCLITVVTVPRAGKVIPEMLNWLENPLGIFCFVVTIAVIILPVIAYILRRTKKAAVEIDASSSGALGFRSIVIAAFLMLISLGVFSREYVGWGGGNRF